MEDLNMGEWARRDAKAAQTRKIREHLSEKFLPLNIDKESGVVRIDEKTIKEIFSWLTDEAKRLEGEQ